MENSRFKFRAWYPEKEKMYELAKVDIWGDPDQAVCDLASVDEELFDIYLNTVKLMQSTFLHDKNGVEIYEDDVLFNKITISQPCGLLTTKTIGDVQILNGMTYLVGKTWQDADGEDVKISEYKCLILKPELFEVIGSIYEKLEPCENFEFMEERK